jgi:hypothetical protein
MMKPMAKPGGLPMKRQVTNTVNAMLTANPSNGTPHRTAGRVIAT